MNSLIDGAASLAAAWPLGLLTVLVGSLFGSAFVRAGRRTGTDVRWDAAGPGRACRTNGHSYLKRETGWCCSQCGDEIGDQTYVPQVTRAGAGV
jgi:ribosomal protein L37AE/L43A